MWNLPDENAYMHPCAWIYYTSKLRYHTMAHSKYLLMSKNTFLLHLNCKEIIAVYHQHYTLSEKAEKQRSHTVGTTTPTLTTPHLGWVKSIYKCIAWPNCQSSLHIDGWQGPSTWLCNNRCTLNGELFL